MPAQEWIYGLVIYFVSIFIIITLFSMAGVLQTNSVIVSGGYNPVQKGSVNASDLPTGVTSSFSWSKWFKDVFSFFVFNISIGNDGSLLYQYFWIFRIMLVYLPVLALILAIWYSLPTVGS
jgi:hypothetical protein